MSYALISGLPFPTLRADRDYRVSEFDEDVVRFLRPLIDDGDGALYRGVRIHVLQAVLDTGVDVTPTTAPIWCSYDFEKAAKYIGGGPPAGAILVYREQLLSRSWQTLRPDASVRDIETVARDYPYRLDLDNSVWYSRFPQPHPGYETEYGYWIPGDAKEALAAVILVGELDAPVNYFDSRVNQAQVWMPPDWLLDKYPR